MMVGRWVAKIAVGLAFLGVTRGVSIAEAQAPAPTSTGTSLLPPVSVMANPYMNPYLNPYLNPLATQQPMNAKNAALYMYMANSANGGIGSGRISGTRPAPDAAVAGQPGVGQNQGNAAKGQGRFGRSKVAAKPVAEMPNSLSTPGGGAARFFNQGPAYANGASRYYSRTNNHFNNNGR